MQLDMCVSLSVWLVLQVLWIHVYMRCPLDIKSHCKCESIFFTAVVPTLFACLLRFALQTKEINSKHKKISKATRVEVQIKAFEHKKNETHSLYLSCYRGESCTVWKLFFHTKFKLTMWLDAYKFTPRLFDSIKIMPTVNSIKFGSIYDNIK